VEVEMEEATAALVSGLGLKGPIREASSATNLDDEDLIYDHDHFINYKV
jgi:hypothetical protein